MASFLAFSLLSITVTSQLPAPTLQPTVSVPAGQIPSICIWDRHNTDNYNTVFNGPFYYDEPTSAGRISWKLVSHSSCTATPHYVYRNAGDTQWWISNVKGSTSHYAECDETDIASCTAGTWSVYERSNQYEVDSAMYAKIGDCPNWNCDTVSLNTATAYCKEFTQQLGDNAWKDSFNYVWYFNPVWWTWICINNADWQYERCDASYVWGVEGWNDVTSGNTVDLSPTITATCVGTGNQPTPQPTDPTIAAPPPTPTPVIAAPTLQPTIPVPDGEKPSICIWGRNNADNYNTVFNGQFYYDGLTTAGKTSWKLVLHSSCSITPYYLYRNAADTQWYISDGKGLDGGYAKCSESDIVSCSAGKWLVYEKSGQYEVDSTMYTKTGDCPNWNCDTISVDVGNTDCQEFTQQLGDNAWKATSGYVWYFNPMWWQWLCVDNTIWAFDDCGVSYQVAAEGWTDVSSGNSVDLTTPTQSTITVTCQGTGNQPTPQPTSPPTGTPPTPKPTQQPTLIPTAQPTMKPTHQPTPQPTANPSAQPTLKPTPQPTDKPIVPGTPTTSPTNKPTSQPTTQPTDKPTLQLTIKPTPQPTLKPTPQPTFKPTTMDTQPTPKPTYPPTLKPTLKPTNKPTAKPTSKPSPNPTDSPKTPVHTTTTMATVPTTTTVGTDSELDCVIISNLDNAELNGNWNKEGTSGGHSMYSLGIYWLYFVDEGSHKYWMIGEVERSTDWSNILAYCLREDVTHCSKAFWVWNEDMELADYVEDSDSLVKDCNDKDDDDKGDVDLKAETTLLEGIVKMWWIWVIIAIIAILSCCLCIVSFMCCCKEKKGAAYFATNTRGDDDL